MKIALVVGINHYKHGGDLFGCVNDAYNVKTILSRHSDGSVNFDCKLLILSHVQVFVKTPTIFVLSSE